METSSFKRENTRQRTKETRSLLTGALHALGIYMWRGAKDDVDDEDERFYDLQVRYNPRPRTRSRRDERVQREGGFKPRWLRQWAAANRPVLFGGAWSEQAETGLPSSGRLRRGQGRATRAKWWAEKLLQGGARWGASDARHPPVSPAAHRPRAATSPSRRLTPRPEPRAPPHPRAAYERRSGSPRRARTR